MNKNNGEDAIKKLLQSYDFSIQNPAHKERLRRELLSISMRGGSAGALSEDELKDVAAAGIPPAPKTEIKKSKD